MTGSAHCTIGPYWRNELGPLLRAHQASARGGDLTVTTTTRAGPAGRYRAHRRYRPPALAAEQPSGRERGDSGVLGTSAGQVGDGELVGLAGCWSAGG